MKQELEDKLIKKYPEIFKDCDKSARESCMAWGLEVGDGWYDLIDRLCASLQWDTDRNWYPQVVAEQVKEKYGGLCFYYRTEDTENMDKKDWRDARLSKFKKACVWVVKKVFPFLRYKFEYNYDKECGTIDGKIRFAQSLSYHICEVCGDSGKINEKGYWKSCRCGKCREAESKSR